MTHQIQASQDIVTQMSNLDRDIKILKNIQASTADTDRQSLIEQIIDAKSNLKKKMINSQNPIKYAVLISMPVIICFIGMDALVYGPQYLITLKGASSNLPAVLLSIWVGSNIFKTFNRINQSMLESKIDELEHCLYGVTLPAASNSINS